jgi:hypothetical protein
MRSVIALESAFSRFPGVTGLLWTWHSAIASSAVFALLSIIDLPSGLLATELAIGWGVSSATRRIRAPLHIAAAAALSRYEPNLARVPIAEMLLAPIKKISELATPPSAGGVRERTVTLMKSADDKLGASAAVNQYGLAYVLSSRVGGAVTMLTVVAAQRAGIDVTSVISNAGDIFLSTLPPIPSSVSTFFSPSTATTTASVFAGRAAASSLLVTFFYPFVISGVASGSVIVGSALDASLRWRALIQVAHEGRETALTLREMTVALHDDHHTHTNTYSTSTTTNTNTNSTSSTTTPAAETNTSTTSTTAAAEPMITPSSPVQRDMKTRLALLILPSSAPVGKDGCCF